MTRASAPQIDRSSLCATRLQRLPPAPVSLQPRSRRPLSSVRWYGRGLSGLSGCGFTPECWGLLGDVVVLAVDEVVISICGEQKSNE